jgi:hypothetical protein
MVVARVPHDSSRVNPEQRQCSLATRGLPLLELDAEGPRCKTRCTLVCLVCGNPMAFPCEPDYTEALDAVDQFEEDELETRSEVLAGGLFQRLGKDLLAGAERRLQRRVRTLGLAWHPRWRKLVHARCVKKEGCGCLLTVGQPPAPFTFKRGCSHAPLERCPPPPRPSQRSPVPRRNGPSS